MILGEPGGETGTAAAADATLTDRAYRALEEEIVTLRLPPGSVVSEALLSKRLAVGRTPVREALQRLARERLVVILPRRGIVVSEIDVAAHLRLLDVRRELERLLARSAARRRVRRSAAGSRRLRPACTKRRRAATISPSCGSTAASISSCWKRPATSLPPPRWR